MLWKLPLPVSIGLKYWLEQMGNRAAFAFHRELVTDSTFHSSIPLNPIVFLAELTFAVSLGVQSRSEVEWIVSESARLVCPDVADVLIGRQAL